MTKDIRKIVASFKKMNDEERYEALSYLMRGHATSPAELSWRARLCTALERSKVYPKESYADPND